MSSLAWSKRALSAVGSALVTMVASSHAGAQSSASEKAAAEALFQQGLELLGAGNVTEACVKLEQSQSIEEGIGTALYLAECYEKAGRTASAWGLFRDAASEAQAQGQFDRAAQGRERADRLEARLSRLVITAAPENRMPGFEVRRNGEAFPRGLWGVAIPVDPGDQRIEAMAPGYQPWAVVISVPVEKANASVAIPVLAAAAAQSAPLPEPRAPAPPDSKAPNAGDTENPGRKQRTIGLIVGGTGVVALGVGSYFGFRAISKNHEAEDDHCRGGGSVCTDRSGLTLTAEAKNAATIANVLVIGGAVLAAGGVTLYLLAPSTDRPSVGIATDTRSARLTWGGAF